METILISAIHAKGVIFNVRFSFDGSILASVSDDRTIRVWKTDVNDKCAMAYICNLETMACISVVFVSQS